MSAAEQIAFALEPAIATTGSESRQPFALRRYQLDACDAIERELTQHRSTLLVMPTGTGKTVVFAEMARRFRARGRTLVLVHREELAT